MKTTKQIELAPNVAWRRNFTARIAVAAIALATTAIPALGSDASKNSETIRPFHVHVSDATLTDLRRRIATTQWPDKETVPDTSQGVQLDLMKKLARYWATDYDWRKVEARLNALPQFVTKIDGLDI